VLLWGAAALASAAAVASLLSKDLCMRWLEEALDGALRRPGGSTRESAQVAAVESGNAGFPVRAAAAQ